MPIWMAQGLPATLKGRTLGYELIDETTSEKYRREKILIWRKKKDNSKVPFYE